MTEDLTQHLVCHRHVRFAPDMFTELPLDHAESALDVGPLVKVPQELLAIEGKVPFPRGRGPPQNSKINKDMPPS
jgi:hypothetical protein